jgi:hypothetical protein
MRKPLMVLLLLAGALHAEEVMSDEFRASISNALAGWHAETNAEAKATLGESIVHQCGIAGMPGVVEELVGGKPLGETMIMTPTNEGSLPLTVLKEWDIPLKGSYQMPEEVIRRLGTNNFELWTPKQGWLFDDKGKVLAEAKVPRRDGTGREWYGAFLPEGQWITTDLWGSDGRLYIFSPDNRLLRAFPARKYTGKGKRGGGYTVAWARADQKGTKWVAQIGLDGGWCGLSVSPWGWWQHLSSMLEKRHLAAPSSWDLAQKVDDPKALVDQRDLGSRGNGILLTAQSSDERGSLEYRGRMHGAEVQLPRYSMRSPVGGWDRVIPGIFQGKYTGRGNFGFFPNSQVAWVGGSKDPIRPNESRGGFRSWLMEPSGKALGWLPAERLCDDENGKRMWFVNGQGGLDPEGKRMWFVDGQGRLLKVAPDGVISQVLRPTLPGATGEDAPFAHVLYPDLNLGFFYTKPGHLVLARWD